MASNYDSSSRSPNKRLKTTTETPSTSSEIEDGIDKREPQENQCPAPNSPSRCCAICFLGDGEAIRGKIDCCDHYFCFLCVMEWSKIESRCPICRFRFNTIRRPPKHGVFSRERVVKVPVRDQVSQIFRNSTFKPI